MKQTNSTARQIWFLTMCVLTCSLLCLAINSAAKTRNEAAVQADNARILAVVQRDFGVAVEVVTAFSPYRVTGDFNGDRLQDLAVVVRIKGSRKQLPKDVRLLNPFESSGSLHFPANPSRENRLALAIVHSWQNAVASGKFLLLGESPILILQNARAISSGASDRTNLIGLRNRNPRRRSSEPFPRNAKGDVILLGTEVGGDSLLYWNGRSYSWEDSAED